MTDLKLVAPDQPTPLERLLMEAVANEAPSAEQRMRVRQALGLPAVAVLAAPVAQAGRRAALFKAAAGGLVAISAVTFLMFTVAGRKAQPIPMQPKLTAPVTAPSAQDTLAVSAPAAAETPGSTVAPLPPVAQVEQVNAPSRSGPRPASAASPSTAIESGADLSEQLRLIDSARAAVAASNPGAASTAIASYRSRFPHGPFGQEATVLQIETLDLQGNHSQASALARTFLARHPNSPHVSLVQRIADR